MARKKKRINDLIVHNILAQLVEQHRNDGKRSVSQMAIPDPDEAELAIMHRAMGYAPHKLTIGRDPILHESMNLYKIPLGLEFRSANLEYIDKITDIHSYDSFYISVDINIPIATMPAKYAGYCWLCRTDHITQQMNIMQFGAGWAAYSCASVYAGLLDRPSQIQALKLTTCMWDVRSSTRLGRLRTRILSMNHDQIDTAVGHAMAVKIMHTTNDDNLLTWAFVSRWWKTWSEIEYHLMDMFGVDDVDGYLAQYVPSRYEAFAEL